MNTVYVTVPNRSGWLHKHCHFAVCRILGDRRYKVRHDCPTHTPYVENLHRCMWDFLEGGEDYWLSFDDDNPPSRNPLDRVEDDLDMVGFPTPVWHSAVKGDRPYYYNALDRVRDGWLPHEPCDGLQEVDAVGSGCMLIARRVMEVLKNSQPFMRVWNPDGTVEIGCDYSFCTKVKAAGFHVYADFDRPCNHFNEMNLSEVIQAFGDMQCQIMQQSG